MRNSALIWFGLFALSTAVASDGAVAQDDPNCWAGKRRTDLRTGEVRFECMREPESWRNFVRLRQLGELGIQDQKDVTFVLEKLQGDGWDLHAEAARTLRLNRYTKAIPQLAASISPNDWRLTFEALAALNEFKAPQADAVLKDVANTYWLPAISEIASDFASGPSLPPKTLATSIRIPVEYCDTQPSKCPTLRDHPSLMGAKQAPLTLDVQGGKFIGTDHGGLNRGYIWEITRSDNGRWSARRLWRLPGSPDEVVAAPDGTIGLFGRFGSVLYRTDDTLQWPG